MKKIVALSVIGNVVLLGLILWMHQRHAKTLTDIYSGTDSTVVVTYNKKKMFALKQAMYNLTPLKGNDIVFVGDSHTEGFPVTELFQSLTVRNRGISGSNSYNILGRIAPIAATKPSKIFLMMGVNDIGQSVPKERTFSNFKAIIDTIRQRSPRTEIFVQSILPMAEAGPTKIIISYNQQLKPWCQAAGVKYINLFPHFFNGQGLKKEYSFDGMHITAPAYAKWKELVSPYVVANLPENKN